MKITIKNESTSLMKKWLSDALLGKVDKESLDKILLSPEYTDEFSRYQNRVSRIDFKDYLISLVGNHNFIPKNNSDLLNHHKYWQDYINHTEYYNKKLDMWLTKITSLELEDLFIKLQSYFLNPIDINTIDIIFTFGIGQSYGFPYHNTIYFDVLQGIKENLFIEFEPTLAHEWHHIILNDWGTTNVHSHNLIDEFVLSFVSEGLAIKFTQNAEGVLSKALYSGTKNIGLDALSIDFLNHDFPNIYKHFLETLDKLEKNKMTKQQLDFDLKHYWLSCCKDPNLPTYYLELKQSRIYTFGNELWGTVYDAYGLDILFDTIAFPSKCLERFKNALVKLNLIDKVDIL